MKKTTTTPVLNKLKSISILPYGGHSRAVIEDKPKEKIQRPAAVYSNRTPFGIASTKK